MSRKRKTNKEFLEQLKKINTNIEVLTPYISDKDKVLCRCKIDGNEWYITPNHLLKGHGCKVCFDNRRSQVFTRSHEEFIEKMNSINPKIEILNKYINSKTYIKCKCKIDNYIWETKPSILLNNHGCPECSKTKPLTTQELKERIDIISPNIEIIGEYINSKSPIQCKCLIDGCIWYPIPNNLLKGTGCPQCAGTKNKTHEEFMLELNKINPNILVLSKYINSKYKIKCQCLIDYKVWWSTPNNLLRGSGCPECNQSKGEKECKRVLISKGFIEISQKEYNKLSNSDKNYIILQKEFKGLIGLKGGNLSFDFYIPKYNLLIEYQGEYHDGSSNNQTEEEFEYQQEHDRRKREYSKNNNINLLEIWYYDFDNIEEILTNQLLGVEYGKNY